MKKAFMVIAVVVLIVLGGVSSAFAQEKILLEDTPEAVRALVAKKYAKYKVVGVKEKKQPNEYSIEMEKGERTVSLVLDASGEVISKTKGRMYSYDGTEVVPGKDGPNMPSMGLQ